MILSSSKSPLQEKGVAQTLLFLKLKTKWMLLCMSAFPLNWGCSVNGEQENPGSTQQSNPGRSGAVRSQGSGQGQQERRAWGCQTPKFSREGRRCGSKPRRGALQRDLLGGRLQREMLMAVTTARRCLWSGNQAQKQRSPSGSARTSPKGSKATRGTAIPKWAEGQVEPCSSRVRLKVTPLSYSRSKVLETSAQMSSP